MEYPTIWTCETLSSTTTCTATATTTGGISYHDWLFVSGIQILFLSFIGIALLFSTFKSK